MKIVKKVTAQLTSRKRELVAELEQVDGALRALADAGGSRDLGPVSRAVTARHGPLVAPRKAPEASRTSKAARKGGKPPAALKGHSGRAPAQPEPPEEADGEPSRLLRGTIGTKLTPKGRTYMVCPKCGKRTETNPCAVCGKKIVIAPSLRSIPAEAFDDLADEGGPEK